MRTTALLLGLIPGLVSALDAPVVSISATMVDDDGHINGDSVFVCLNWDLVPEANYYTVYYQPQLSNVPALLGYASAAPFELSFPTDWGWAGSPDVLGFFSVTAESLDVESPEMIAIPAGQFMMGQTGVATPEHQVTLTHNFLLGRTEVTNQQFLDALNWANTRGYVTVVGDHVQQYGVNLLWIASGPDYYEIQYDQNTQQFYLHAGTAHIGAWGPGQAYPDGYDPTAHPMKWVTWYGAACYCDWLSSMNGLPAYYNGNWNQIPSPNNPYAAAGFRLPTEAEWEFAAQYNDERTYPWGSASPNCTLANFYPNDFCVGWTSPVGTHPAGASSLGLQDMEGNVAEWCNDWFGSYNSSAQINPVGPANGSNRVSRSGCWANDVSYLPCAYRETVPPSVNDGGFRLCRVLP